MFGRNQIMRLSSWVYQIVRWELGGIFIYSGAAKLLAPQIFAVLIEAYGLVPDMLLMPVALILPALEVVAGVGLLLDIRGSLTVIAGLLLLFIAILGYGIRMGLDVDCGCFGSEEPEAEAFHGLRLALYRDMVMLAAVIFLYGWRRYRCAQPRKTIPSADKGLTRVDQKIIDEY
ncbi:MauE/DoxX family redox-associated membrane protein [Desulfosarcina sp.]|uniref:MauE/DoxX family redox-associated membrane protein n=1 Tax=Desulfosarcina sp. TaxID=2027861 RepID=UPI00356419CB